ncbi:histidine kinase [Herbiconiux ginsengi]|uniref:histidine kinase n=1 Tax=Herbiconiux ginsengi TaxID=381665 RepID=A0A1H3KU89_9MICO|nr:histidine kinase [Herbiconiux ginsengi]SDY55318.1 Signal transduction histidine kinase [Herbiconiux ginsengi]
MITSPDGGRTWLSRALTLLGVAVVAFFAWRDTLPQADAWVVVLVGLALACWVATLFVPRRFTTAGTALLTVMVLSSAVVVVPSNGVLVVTVAVGLVLMMADLGRPLWQAIALGVVAVVIVPISSLSSPITPLGILSIEAGIVVAVLAGLSRRQFRAAEAQARQLLEERVAAREEMARATVLASRQQVARDIHDVLAHSLGGLVIQLDAVDALLEAGRTDDAAGRVRDARELAVSGLTEARRAVDALRDVSAAGAATGVADAADEETDSDAAGASRSSAGGGSPSSDAARELVRELGVLADAHRALGGTIDFTVIDTEEPPPSASPSARMLDADAVVAVRRAFQESLTNARKHAPGRPVTAELRWAGDGSLDLRVENPLALSARATAPSSGTLAAPAAPAAPAEASGSPAASVTSPDAVAGGSVAAAHGHRGHGLEGMAERFGAVRGGSVDAGEHDGRFVVLARVEAVMTTTRPTADTSRGQAGAS